MVELPVGTVSFLFTDLEGSTRRWEELPAAMGPALARHDAILEAAFAAHGGVVLSRMGDGMAVAFPSAGGAVAAAIDAQRELTAESWRRGGDDAVRDRGPVGRAVPSPDRWSPRPGGAPSDVAGDSGGVVLDAHPR